MSLLRNTALVIASSFVFVLGCSSGSDSENTQTIRGKLGSGGTSTQSIGGISVKNGTAGLHVTARAVHKQGGGEAKIVSAPVDGNGEFRLDVARGSRYVVLVESSDKRSAMVTLGNKNNVVSVGANGNGASVDLGRVQVVGGEARASVTIDGSTGVSFGTADLDDVFEDVDGALKSVQDAIAEAEKAAAEAIKEAEAASADAQKAADEARKAAEAAQQAAGR
jgi:Sec-independent protein translocase protein TatA